MLNWIVTNWIEATMVMVSALLLYVVVLCCVRITGLRGLAKMSPTDFLWTVATGSLLASAIASPSPTVVLATVAFATIFAIQWVIAVIRQRSKAFESVISNQPVLLMDGSRILEKNLRRVHVSRCELRSKLREANVLNYNQIRAVVMETTGDISVLHSSDPNERFDQELIRDVDKGAEIS